MTAITGTRVHHTEQPRHRRALVFTPEAQLPTALSLLDLRRFPTRGELGRLHVTTGTQTHTAPSPVLTVFVE